MKTGETQAGAFSGLVSPFSFIYDACLTLVYPQACNICEKSVESRNDGFVCDRCWRKTHIYQDKEITCQKCHAFLKSGIPSAETFCRRCERDEYDLARAVGLYERGLSTSILTLKNEPFLPLRLRNLLVSAFQNSPFQDTTRIIPVPLSERRFKERGFNQAAIIAQAIAKPAGITIDELSLARIIHTGKHRAGMDRKARGESVRGAFLVKRPRLIVGENILLVDDVFTTGATVSNCAKVLKESGARKVYVLTIARAF